MRLVVYEEWVVIVRELHDIVVYLVGMMLFVVCGVCDVLYVVLELVDCMFVSVEESGECSVIEL